MSGNKPDLAEEIIEWDVRNWNHALRFWEEEVGNDLSGYTALEIGGRNGGISLWLALKGAWTICSDLNGPSPDAKELHDKYGVSHLIKYRSVDVTRIPYKEESFDIVAFKSVIGDVGDKERQRKAFLEIHRVLKPSGKLLFAENLKGSPMHMFLRRRFVRWGKAWRYLEVEEIEEFLSPFSSWKYETYGFLGALGRREWQRRGLSYIDLVLNPLIPRSWRYIIFGVAVK